MHVLGQFAVVDHPDRFLWIRGFADMKTRRRGLDGFYDGAFWQARRAEANAMIRDHEDVHLLQPLDHRATDRRVVARGLRSRRRVSISRRRASLSLISTGPRAGLIAGPCVRGRLRPALLERGDRCRALRGQARAQRLSAPGGHQVAAAAVLRRPGRRDDARLHAEGNLKASRSRCRSVDVVTVRLQRIDASICVRSRPREQSPAERLQPADVIPCRAPARAGAREESQP